MGNAQVTAGNLVQAGPPTATLLTTVVSLDPIYVYFEADERTYLKYARLAPHGGRPSSRDDGTPIYLGLANEDGLFPHKGYVDFVDNQLDPETGTIRARAVFSNTDRLFTPGLFARLKLVGSAQVPRHAGAGPRVGTDQDKKFVLVLKPDSTVSSTGPCSSAAWSTGSRVVAAGASSPATQVVRVVARSACARPGMRVTADAGADDCPTRPPAPRPDSKPVVTEPAHRSLHALSRASSSTGRSSPPCCRSSSSSPA